MPEHTCGQCRHWKRDWQVDGITWGGCRCPLPEWVYEAGDAPKPPPIAPDNPIAGKCRHFRFASLPSKEAPDA